LPPENINIPGVPIAPILEGFGLVTNRQSEDQIVGDVSQEVKEQLLEVAKTVSSIVVTRNGGIENRCAAFTTGKILLDGLEYDVHQSAAHCFDGISADSLATIQGTTVAMNRNLLRQSYLAADRRVGPKSQFDSALLLVPSVGTDDSEMLYAPVDVELLDYLIKNAVTIYQVGFPVSAQQQGQSVIREIREMLLDRYEMDGLNSKMYFKQVGNRESSVTGDRGYSGGPLFYFDQYGKPVIIAVTHGVTHYEGQDDVLETIGISLMPEDATINFVNASSTDFLLLNWDKTKSALVVQDEQNDFPIYSGNFNLPEFGASLMRIAGCDREQAEYILALLKLGYLNGNPEELSVVAKSTYSFEITVRLQDGRIEHKLISIQYDEHGNIVGSLVDKKLDLTGSVSGS